MRFDLLGAVPLEPSGGKVAALTIAPLHPNVKPGETIQFTAVATDAVGKSFVPPVVSWTLQGPGSLSPSGLYTSSTTGSEAATVSARSGSVVGETTVTILEAEGDEPEPDYVSETVDDLVYPRQGLASFHASLEEIDKQPDTRYDIRRHYPDLAETEGWPIDEAAADAFAGFDAVGGGGGHGGGGHHGGGHHHGGGVWGGDSRFGGWGWGGPWYPSYDPIEIVEVDPASREVVSDDEIVNAVAEAVAQKLAKRSDKNTAVGQSVGDDAMRNPGFVDGVVKDFTAKLAGAPVTYSVARSIADRSMEMLARADANVKKQGSASLINAAITAEPRGRIQWHLNAISKIGDRQANYVETAITARDPKSTPYENAEDLKKWAAVCYRIFMMSEQEATLRDQFNAEFWADVVQVVKDIPANVRKELSSGVEWATGIPTWAWALIITAIVGTAGWIAVKFILPVILPLIGPAVAKRYFG